MRRQHTVSVLIALTSLAVAQLGFAANEDCRVVEDNATIKIEMCLLTTDGPSAVNGDLRARVTNVSNEKISVDLRCTTEFSEPMSFKRTRIERFGVLFIDPARRDGIIMEGQMNPDRRFQWTRQSSNFCTFKIERSKEKPSACPTGQSVVPCPKDYPFACVIRCAPTWGR